MYLNKTRINKQNGKKGICIYREQFKHKQILYIIHNMLCCNHQRRDKLTVGSDWWMSNMKES